MIMRDRDILSIIALKHMYIVHMSCLCVIDTINCQATDWGLGLGLGNGNRESPMFYLIVSQFFAG